jgi:hypothetical protein
MHYKRMPLLKCKDSKISIVCQSREDSSKMDNRHIPGVLQLLSTVSCPVTVADPEAQTVDTYFPEGMDEVQELMTVLIPRLP